jgi:catechol 2,3-dioxygenase-like lactoylglutathione lyase family enzyme
MKHLNAITHAHVWVLDHQQALDFYVGKLGLEVNTDADLGFMRWLTVCVPGNGTREILLERPGAPALDDATAQAARELLTKGATAGALLFTTSDPLGMHERLVAAGVEITGAPTERDYGTDFGIRDPFGSKIRIGSRKDQ